MARSRKRPDSDRAVRSRRRLVMLLILPFIAVIAVVVMLASGRLPVWLADAASRRAAAAQAGADAVPGKDAAPGADGMTADDAMDGGAAEPVPGDPESGDGADGSAGPDNSKYILDFGGSILERDAVPGINDLMEAYFRAELDCDVETLNSLFTSGDTSQAEAQRAELEALCQYVEGYGNISCYTVHGPAEDLYIAYTYYETKYFLADSWAPGLVNPYVQRQEDGSFKIYDEELTPEMEEFLEKAQVNEDVHLLISQVDRQLAQVLETDGELNAMVEYLKQGKTYETESQGE